MISDLNLLFNHYDSIVCDLICKLCTHIIVRIQRPLSDRNWDNQRGWLWCEDHMCSRSVNALLRCSIKRSTLMASSSLEAPLPRAGWTEDVVQVVIASTYDYIWSTCLGLFSTWMLILIYLKCPRSWSYMFRLVHATPIHPSLCVPRSYPTVCCHCYYCSCFTVVVALLLLLSNCCYW